MDLPPTSRQGGLTMIDQQMIADLAGFDWTLDSQIIYLRSGRDSRMAMANALSGIDVKEKTNDLNM